MTRFHREFVSCPHCLNEEEIVIWDQVDADTDPDLKDRLLRKKLQVFECRNCGRTHLLSHPLLYKDDLNRLIIWCDPQLAQSAELEKTPELLDMLPANDGYTFRLVVSANDMNEKIHLADYQMDDRIMEIVKQAVLAWQQEEIKVRQLYFLSAEEDRMLFLALGDDDKWYQLPVAIELYHRIELLLSDALPKDKGWQKVDADYAEPYFKKLG